MAKRIGRGGYGTVFLACNLQTSEQIVANLENRRSRSLQCEADVCNAIHADGYTPGFPRMIFHGSQDSVEVLFIEHFGFSV